MDLDVKREGTDNIHGYLETRWITCWKAEDRRSRTLGEIALLVSRALLSGRPRLLVRVWRAEIASGGSIPLSANAGRQAPRRHSTPRCRRQASAGTANPLRRRTNADSHSWYGVPSGSRGPRVLGRLCERGFIRCGAPVWRPISCARRNAPRRTKQVPRVRPRAENGPLSSGGWKRRWYPFPRVRRVTDIDEMFHFSGSFGRPEAPPSVVMKAGAPSSWPHQ